MLITGATGFIGARLATLSCAHGYAVKTFTRSDWAGHPAVPVGQRYFGSLPEQIPVAAVREVDVIVHCAARLEPGERSAYAVNVDGTIRLAHMARQAGVHTFIFLSSQSARPDALSAYGRTKYAAEQALLGLDGLQVIIVRPGLVVGPGNRGLFQRMCRTVEALPVIPVLGGGHSIVQPIHVDDVCTAIFRCDETAPELHQRILQLGHPHGVSLAAFLQAMALARLGRRKITLPIPLWPVEMAVGIAEGLGIPLPISSNNLQGLKVVERMDTQADMARLRLHVRPLDEMLRADAESVVSSLALRDRAVRVVLIGAGRIGLVHAVTLSRLHGVVLSGIVDPKIRATAFLRGMGLSVPMFQSLDEALTQAQPDAVVIATPVATHLPLARACLAQGLAVLIEKPLAIRRAQLADYERLAQEFPGCPIQVGYVMPRNPQVASCLDRLCAGQFGKVQGFVGITLLSFIQERNTRRWEVQKEVSGGGALINAGGHVLSMIRAAFGEPQEVEAQHVKLYSTEVEDSMAITLTYPEFRGTHYCSWSIEGYPRQENMLTIWTDQGRLILTSSVGIFVGNEGDVDVTHQLDFDVGFNMAPDYAGAGFTTEMTDLSKAARTRQPAPMNLMEAIQLERLLFKIYEVSHEVHPFTQGQCADARFLSQSLRLSGAVSRPEDTPPSVRRVLDVRDLAATQVHAYLGAEDGRSGWDEFLLTPGQMRGIPTPWGAGERLRITVPDFLNQSRLLAAGRYREVLKQMGLSGGMLAAWVATPALLRDRAATFWVAAMGLLGAGLQAVPVDFRGTLLLHTYLTDFALSLTRLDMLQKMLATCRSIRPRARLGFHTNMAAEALQALWLLDVPVNEVSILTSPSAPEMAATLAALRRAGAPGALRLTAEVGPAPAVVHRVAYATPHRWAHGADAVLIGIGADQALARQRQQEVEQAWVGVFPGLSLPEGVL